MEEYIIAAYSKSRNQEQRQLNLDAGDPRTLGLARQTAQAFADALNQKTSGVKDWVGRVTPVDPNHFRTL